MKKIAPNHGEWRRVRRFAWYPVYVTQKWRWLRSYWEYQIFNNCWADGGWKHKFHSIHTLKTNNNE